MTNRIATTGILLVLLFAGFENLSAQYGKSLSSDRPGQAITPLAVGARTIQLQSGVNFADGGAGGFNTLSVSNYLRVGILEKLEINAALNWARDKNDAGNAEGKGVSDTQIGLRYNIYEGNGLVPVIGVQGSVLLKAQSEYWQRDNTGGLINFTAASPLADWLAATLNLGVTWPGYSSSTQWTYVLNFATAFGKVGAFAEIYGQFNDFDINLDGGLSYLVTPNFQLDVLAGYTGDSTWFIEGGVTVRLDWR